MEEKDVNWQMVLIEKIKACVKILELRTEFEKPQPPGYSNVNYYPAIDKTIADEAKSFLTTVLRGG